MRIETILGFDLWGVHFEVSLEKGKNFYFGRIKGFCNRSEPLFRFLQASHHFFAIEVFLDKGHCTPHYGNKKEALDGILTYLSHIITATDAHLSKYRAAVDLMHKIAWGKKGEFTVRNKTHTIEKVDQFDTPFLVWSVGNKTTMYDTFSESDKIRLIERIVACMNVNTKKNNTDHEKAVGDFIAGVKLW